MKQKLPRGIGTLGLGLLILVLVPLVWSVPEALIVGELARMLSEEGGYHRVKRI